MDTGPTSRMRRALNLRATVLIAGIACFLALAGPVRAQSLPAEAARLLPGAREAGSGTLRYFGLLVYDAKLWTTGARFDAGAPFALGIRYARNIKGQKLVRESVNQWRGMRYGYEDRYAAWEAEMQRIFPDVVPEDELVGVYLPGTGARFYFNGKLTGEVADLAFARAIFAIWLDERSTEPGLRRALIAEK